MGTAAAAGWATSPSAEVKPRGEGRGIPGGAAGLCATLTCVSAPSSPGHAGTQPRAPTALSGSPPGLPRLPAPLPSLSAVNCGRPEADFNSVVHGNDWWVGSVVRYSCRPGFLLLGDPASACQSDGRWTPKPSCLREYRGCRAAGTSPRASTSPR